MVSVGGELAPDVPTLTTTSSDSGVVLPLPMGVMWISADGSEKVAPMTSGESFLSSGEPGDMSRSCVPLLLPLVVAVLSARPHGPQLMEAPLVYHGLVESFWRNSI